MNYIPPNSPAYYLTSVTKDRLPVFRRDVMKSIACSALDEARTSGKFLILGYVIMPDHVHLISDGEKRASEVLRFINGLISRRIIDFLKQEGHALSLKKLRHESYRRGHEYSLWDHHPNVRLLTSESMFMQRVHYTHQNPLRLGMVERADDYRYSSVRIWNPAILLKLSRCWLILVRSSGEEEAEPPEIILELLLGKASLTALESCKPLNKQALPHWRAASRSSGSFRDSQALSRRRRLPINHQIELVRQGNIQVL